MKSNYVYLAIGLDKRYLDWLYRFNLPILQLYIGVRTGELPDNSYKTSSKNKSWLYLHKHVLALFEDRLKANEAEIGALRACIEAGSWALLANRAVGGTPSMAGLKHSTETKLKQSISMQGKNKGKKRTELERQAQSDRMNGTKLPEEWCRAISKGQLGNKRKNPYPESARIKLRIANLGQNNAMYDKNHTKETKALQSDIAKQRWQAKMQAYCPIILISPANEHIVFYNAKDFDAFIELGNNIRRDQISKLISSKIKSSKGWRLDFR